MKEIEVGDIIEVIENLEEHKSFHEFRIGYKYEVKEICIVDHNTKLYMLIDFDPHTAKEFKEGVYRDEIKFIKKGK